MDRKSQKLPIFQKLSVGEFCECSEKKRARETLKMTLVKKQPPSYYDVHDAKEMRMKITAKCRKTDSLDHSFTHQW